MCADLTAGRPHRHRLRSGGGRHGAAWSAHPRARHPQQAVSRRHRRRHRRIDRRVLRPVRRVCRSGARPRPHTPDAAPTLGAVRRRVGPFVRAQREAGPDLGRRRCDDTERDGSRRRRRGMGGPRRRRAPRARVLGPRAGQASAPARTEGPERQDRLRHQTLLRSRRRLPRSVSTTGVSTASYPPLASSRPASVWKPSTTQLGKHR